MQVKFYLLFEDQEKKRHVKFETLSLKSSCIKNEYTFTLVLLFVYIKNCENKIFFNIER